MTFKPYVLATKLGRFPVLCTLITRHHPNPTPLPQNNPSLTHTPTTHTYQPPLPPANHPNPPPPTLIPLRHPHPQPYPTPTPPLHQALLPTDPLSRRVEAWPSRGASRRPRSKPRGFILLLLSARKRIFPKDIVLSCACDFVLLSERKIIFPKEIVLSCVCDFIIFLEMGEGI